MNSRRRSTRIVAPHLSQDGQIHADLKTSTNRELNRGASEEEVGSLKHVSAEPHHHHRQVHATS